MFSLFSRPPSAKDVVHRAHALRSAIVGVVANPPPEILEELRSSWSLEEWDHFIVQAEEYRSNHLNEIESSAFGKSLTPYERKILETRVESRDQQDYVNLDWRIESFLVLLWSIGRIDSLSPLETVEQASPDILKLEALGEFEVNLKQASLRDSSEISKARDMAEFWHWRSRTREIIESGKELDSAARAQMGVQSYDDIVRHAAVNAHQRGDLSEIVDEDFAVHGTAYRDLDEIQWGLVRSVTMERHFALNWLCGHAERNRWDDTPTDT